MRYTGILTAILGMAAATPLVAQTAMTFDAANSGANPAGIAITPTTKPAVLASFNTDEKMATITGAFQIDWPGSDGDGLLTISAQTPLAQGQNYVNTVTLDGLTKATAVSITFSYLSNGFAETTDRKLYSEASQAECKRLVTAARAETRRVQDQIGKEKDPDGKDDAPHVEKPPLNCGEADVREALDALYKTDVAYLNSPGQAELAVQEATAKIEKAAAGADAAKQAAAEQKLSEIASKKDAFKAQLRENRGARVMLERNYHEFSDKLTPTLQSSWALSFNVKTGYESHDFYDPLDLSKQTANKTPWQVGVSVGYIFTSRRFSLHGSFNYQQSYLDGGTGETQTKCLVDLTCATGFIGAPLFKEKALFSGDLRWLIDDFAGLGTPVGFAPRFTYDALSGAQGVQVPIYLLSDDDGKLAGGVRYDWTSTTHVSTVGIFVSAAFSVL